MSAAAVAALLAAIAGTAGVTGLALNAAGSKKEDYDEAELRSKMDDATGDVWDSLSASQRQSIIEKYYEEDHTIKNFFGFGGGKREVLDTERLLNDLAGFKPMYDAYAELERPVYDNYLNAAREQVSTETAEMYDDLDALLAEYTDSYNTQLGNISSEYNKLKRNLVDQQYLQNAQLMDTYNSNLDRSRRNAIESGASAGLRIAENVNQLLSVQNQQASVSMNTANQLAQMMVNQRNAETALSNDYFNYKSQDLANRHNLKLSSEQRATSLANTNYNAAYDEYSKKEQDLDKIYGDDNPLYDYRNYKSKYNSASSSTGKYGG